MKQKYNYFLWILISFFTGISNLRAEIDFKKLTMQDGLADNMVFHIHKDRYGYLWFGNNNGITRYDGNNIKNFRLSKEVRPITNIQETGNGFFYLQAEKKLLCFNYALEHVSPVVSSKNALEVFVTDFLVENDTCLITCCNNTIDRLCLRNGNNVTSAKEIFSIKDEQVEKICFSKDSSSIYAITERGTICHYSLKEGRIFYTTSLTSEPLYIHNYVSACQLYDNFLWITTRTVGIFVYDTRTKKIWHLQNESDTSPTVLSHSEVYRIIRLFDNNYLALTWSGYTLISYTPENANVWKTSICNESPNWVTEKIETRMISGYYDPAGILWVGTHGGGVLHSDRRREFFNQFHQKLHNEIGGIVIDEKNYIYLSTFHQGILKSLSPFTDTTVPLMFKRYFNGENGKYKTFLCAEKDLRGTLWFGGARGILLEKSVHSEKGTFYVLPSQESIKCIFADMGGLWLGTDHGLFWFSLEEKHFEKIQVGLPDTEIYAIEKDKNGAIWLAMDTGVVKLGKRNGNWRIDIDYRMTSSLQGGTVYDVFAASDSCLYLACTKGLGIVNPGNPNDIELFTTKDGLCSNWIYCITEDDNGHIWLGSNSGITHYIRNKKLFYNYYISGSTRSVYKQNDMLFWGGSKNFTSFSPKQAISSFELPQGNKVIFTELEVNGKVVPIGKSVNGQIILSHSLIETGNITLSYVNRDFSLSFSDLTYSEDLQKYSYRLLPYQSSWITGNTRGKVSYTSLPSGNYVFEIKPISLSGNEGPVSRLKIRIEPHWSSSIWFRLFILCGVLLFAFYLFKKEKRRRRRWQQHLQLKHELKMSNMEREHEKAIRQERESFFIQTAHELRTPLTLILSPLSELVRQGSGVYSLEDLQKRLSRIQEHALVLQDLTDQLLYMQRIHLGTVKLYLSHLDIVPLIREIAEGFRDLSVINHINFTLVFDKESCFLWFDLDKLRRAVSNLLSNAFKYTSSGGEIHLFLSESIIQGKTCCMIRISDNGVGIPVDILDHIFEPFFIRRLNPTVSTQQGIGLYIVKHTVDIHHGFITVDSKIGEGSCFTVYIPEGKEHFDGDEYETVSGVVKSESKKTDFCRAVEETKSKKSRHSILIIEDNGEVREYIRSLFFRQYTVYEAADGEEGMDMAFKYLPTIIISDIMMPIKNGIECVSELRREYTTAHIPIIILTAKGEDKDVIEAIQAGADDYLIKPFNPEVLKVKVNSLIMGREKLKRMYTQSLMMKEENDKVENLFIQQVINVIEQNFTNESFDVAMLADCLHISQPTLRRKIKKYSKLSAMELIRSVRISKAAVLIQKECYSIQEICEMVGYNDMKTFRKNFMDQFGVLPSKFDQK